MLNIRVERLSEDAPLSGDNIVIHVNDLEEHNGYFELHPERDKRPSISLKTPAVFQELINHSFWDIYSQIYKCNFSQKIAGFKCWLNIELDYVNEDVYDEDGWEYEKNKKDFHPHFSIIIHPDAEDWVRPYSVRQLAHKMKELSDYDVFPATKFEFDDSFMLIISTRTVIKHFNQQMEPIVNEAISYTEDLITRAVTLLKTEVEDEVLTTFFQFPPALKTAMKQYLVYFAQFLLDFGIEIETEIREELNETLFKVIPKNKTESLERIHEALAIYLNLPGMPPEATAEMERSNEVALMQLQFNINSLKNQMMLMQTTVQMKDTMIEMLQLSNYELKSQIKETANKHGAEERETEDVIRGVVAVEKFKWMGLVIDSPNIVRWLKEYVKRRF